MAHLQLEKAFPEGVAGIDEVGRGPLAGPVVAAAVILKPGIPDALISLLADSKTLSARRREKLAEDLENHVYAGFGLAAPEEIDSINIFQATLTAMRRAVDSLPFQPSALLVDGTHGPRFEGPVQTVVGGDNISASIAAASILAKVRRDAMMAALSAEFPVYGWEKNAGYGTAQHQQAMRTHGVCVHHRRSFRPVQEALRQSGEFIEKCAELAAHHG